MEDETSLLEASAAKKPKAKKAPAKRAVKKTVKKAAKPKAKPKAKKAAAKKKRVAVRTVIARPERLAMRLSKAEKAKLIHVAKKRGCTMTQVVYDAIADMPTK